MKNPFAPRKRVLSFKSALFILSAYQLIYTIKSIIILPEINSVNFVNGKEIAGK